MSNKRTFQALVLAAALSAASGLAGAQPSTGGYIDEVNKRKANVELIKAKIEEARAQSDLAQLQYKISQMDTSAGSTASVEDADDEMALEREQPAPQVMAIFGSDGKLYASLRYKSGLIQDVRAGELIDGGFRVKSVSVNRVVLVRDGKQHTLHAYGGSNHDSKTTENMAQSALPTAPRGW